MRMPCPERFLSACGAILLAALGPAPVAAAEPDPGWAERTIVRSLSERLGGPVRFDDLEVDWLRLEARFTGAYAEARAEGAPPARIRARAGRLRLAWAGLPGLAAGRIRITAVELEEPAVELSGEFLRAFRSRGGSGKELELRIDRARVRGGRFVYRDAVEDLLLEVGDVSFDGAWSSYRRTLVGEASAEARITRSPIERPLPLRVRGGLRIREGKVEFYSARVEGAELRAGVEGAVTWGGGAVLSARALVNGSAAALRPYLASDFPEIEGALAGELLIDRPARGPLTIAGPVRANGARFGPLSARRAAAEMLYREGRLVLADLSAAAYGGAVSGKVEVRFGDRPTFRAEARVSGADARALLELAGRSLPVASSVEGTVALGGEAGRLESWTGEARFTATAAAVDPVRPIAASGTGRIAFDGGRVRTPETRLRLSGADLALDLDLPVGGSDPPGRFEVRGTTSDARRTRAGVVSLLEAFEVAVPEVLREELEGQGSIGAAAFLGTPVELDVDLALDRGGFAGRPFERGTLRLAMRGDRLEILDLTVRDREARLSAKARLQLDPLAIDSIAIDAESVPLRDLLARLDAELDVDGSLSGRLLGERSNGVLRGEGEVRVERGTAFGEPIDRLSGRVILEGNEVRIAEIDLRGGALEAAGFATVDLETGRTAGRIEAGRVDLGRSVFLAARNAPIAAEVTLRGEWGYSREAGPSADLALASDRIDLPGVLPDGTLGGASGRLRWIGGKIEFALGAPESGWEIAGRAGLEDGMPGAIAVRLDRFYLPAPGAADAGVGALLTGSVEIEGPLARPEALQAVGSITGADLDVSGRTFHAAAPIPLVLREGELLVGPAGFFSEGASFGASLSWDVERDRLEGALRGEIDLALASLLRKEIRASGRLTADLSLTGSRTAPELRGRVDVREGRLRWLGIREALDGVVAEVEFAGRRAALRTFRALSGGGEIEGSGEVLLGTDGIPDADLRFRISGVAFELPEHFRGTYDGTLAVRGSPKDALLEGELSLLRGVYVREFDLAALAGGAAREVESDPAADLPAGIRLDLAVTAPDNVWIRNNLARVEGSVGLRISGDLRKPEVLGRIGVFEGGRIRFRDVDYRVLSGSLEFDERDRIDPFLELEGETRVREYDVRLRVAGKLDRFEYELTSHPPLPQSDIVYLLLTGSVPYGDGRADAGTGAGATGDLAADYFAGVLTGTLSRQLERALGLDQFRINPLLEGQVDPTARITVGKQVTDRLRILYSADVGSSERQLYQAEWDASRRFAVTAERDTTGGYGASLRFSDRYGRGDGLRGRAGASRDVRRRFRVEDVAIEGVEGPLAERLRRKVRLDPGDAVGRAEIYSGAERMRAHLVEEDRLEASVSFDIEEGDEGHAELGVPARIRFKVRPGPVVRVELVGVAGRLARQLEKDLEAYWLEAVPVGGLAEEAADRVRSVLRSRGHYAADVTASRSGDESTSTLRVVVDAGPVVKPSSVRIEGVSDLPEERVRRQILTGRTEGLGKRPLSPEILEEDGRAVETLFRSEGFLDAKVDPPQVRLAVDGSAAEVIFRVEAGTRYRIGEIDVAIADGPADIDRDRILPWSGLREGEPLSLGALARAETGVRDGLDREGHPEARVEISVERSDGVADLRIAVAPGPRKRFRGIELRGAFRTRERVVRREMTLRPGDPISASELLRLQHRLYRLGVFRSVRVGTEPVPGGGAEDWNVVVTVEEAKPVALATALGYDSEAGARLSFGIGHDNLWGLDRGLTLQARRSDLERRVQLVGKDPWLFGRRLDTTANVYWEELEEVGFTVERRAFALRVERKLGSAWTRFVRYNYQKIDLDIPNPTPDISAIIREQKLADLRLGDVGLTFARDTRDDPFLPTTGGTLVGEGRIFHPAVASDESFVKVFLQGSATRGLGRGAAYAVALRVGAAKSFGDTDTVPISERFFAGGESTLRGFRRDTLGLVVDDLAVGGEGLLLLNQEIRFPLWRALKGTVFTDWGNVFADLSSFDPTDLRYAAGIGLRFETPIGPLRLEYGRKLDRRPGESPGEFYFAIGTIY